MRASSPSVRCRSRSSPTRKGRGSLRTCSGAWCSSAGCHSTRHSISLQPTTGPASATNSSASATPGESPCPTDVDAARLRRTPHRAGPDPRGRGHHDRCGRGGAGHLVDRDRHRRPVGPCRDDADASASRPCLLCRCHRHLRSRPHTAPGRRPGRHRRTHRRVPEPGQRRCRPAWCSPSICETPTTRSCKRPRPDWPPTSRNSPRARGWRSPPPHWPIRTGRIRPCHGRPRRGDRTATRSHDETDVERGRSRRPDARTGLSHRHGVHTQRQRPQPQHRRVHRRRPTSKPAPTSCSRWRSTCRRPNGRPSREQSLRPGHARLAQPGHTRRFWSAVLDLHEVEREDGDRWIVLADADGRRCIGLQRGATQPGSVHLDVACVPEAFEEELSRLRGLGAASLGGPRREPYGSIANLADPDGNPFDLCAYS